MKKFFGALLTFSFVVSLFTYNAAAYSVENQIKAERNKLHESIKEQLIEQNSLYLMEHFDALIDDMLSVKYAPTDMARAAAPQSWYAPNGGEITGTGTYINVQAQFFNIKDTRELYNKRNDPNLVSAAVKLVVGSLWTPLGVLFGLADICNTFCREAAWKNIDIGNEGCYIYAVYDTLEMKTTTVVIGWDPPYMYLSSTIKVTDHYVNPY